jgi:L-alanine-DL-glutamate epimerase-like enolase superfamily enzyme
VKITVDQPLRRHPARQPTRPRDGIVSVPEEPAIGVELDADAVRRYEVAG